ncbi:MAG: hypothetical protein AAF688_03395 [Bacteroidota bacterium]
MRNLTVLLTSLILIFYLNNSQAQTFKNASEYLDFVAEEQNDITKDMWKYTKAVAHSKSDGKIDRRRKNLLKTVDEAIKKIQKAEGFGESDYKSKVLRHIQFSKDLLNEDYAKIVDMKAVAEQSYDAMEAYILAQEMADKKMEESQQEYERDFYAFANENNIQIIESETDLGKKMTISNEVFKYKSDLYLIYFKVFINEVYLMDALERGDVSALQQNSNALNAAAKEGLEILKEQELYKNDGSIIKSTESVFEFFIEESENYVPQITEFLVLNEDFEAIKNTMEKMNPRKRTQKQIDEYNEKVKQLNKGVKNYNKINAELNNKRQQAINKLYDTYAKFLDKHVPND